MRRSITYMLSLMAAVCLLLYALHIFGLSAQAFRIPSSIKVEFYSGEQCWKVRHLRTVESAPVRAEDISPSHIKAARVFAAKKYNAENIRLFYGRALSALIAQERSGTNVLVRVCDELTLALYYAARFDEKTLAAAFFNRKILLQHIAGMDLCAHIGYGKSLAQLDDQEFTALFRYYCAPSQKNIAPDIFFKINLYAQKLVLPREDPFCGTPADYCESVLKSMDLYPAQQSLRIYTTLDIAKQKEFEAAAPRFITGMEGQPAYKKALLKKLPSIECAALASDVHSGAVRAMTGGVTYGEKNRLNRSLSRRQISSTFKPFLYAQAFEDGICTPDTLFEDKPVTVKNRDGSVWEPKNFYPYYIGQVRAKDALSLSINTVSVQLIDRIGIGRMTRTARRLFAMPENSIVWRISDEPSLALGSIDCSPLELSKAYLTLASGGKEKLPYIIEKVMSADGAVLYAHTSDEENGRRIFKENTCRTVTGILKNVIRTGTASKFIQKKFLFDAAGKSGSSPADSWFAGYNPETLIVVWAGYDMPALAREGKIPEFTIIPFWYHLMSQEKPQRTAF